MHLINKSTQGIHVIVSNSATGEKPFDQMIAGSTQTPVVLSSNYTYNVTASINGSSANKYNLNASADVIFSINNGTLSISVQSPSAV